MRIMCLCKALILLIGFSSTSTADTILFDSSGFETYNVGALVGQNGWNVDNASNYQVANGIGVGGTRGITVGGGTTDWAYPTLNYTAGFNETIVIEADLARTLGTTSSFGYSIDLYTPAVTRITRFGLTVAGGEIRPFYSANDGTGAAVTTLIGPAVAANTFQSFRAELNFATDTMTLFLNGTNVANNVALLLNASAIGDADFQVSTAAGANDVGFMDNYRVLVTVPEPSSMLLALGAIPGLVWVRRRIRKS